MGFAEHGEPEGVRRGLLGVGVIMKNSTVSQCHPVDENITPRLTVQFFFVYEIVNMPLDQMMNMHTVVFVSKEMFVFLSLCHCFESVK